MTARPPVSNELLRQLLVWFFVSFVCIHFHSFNSIQSVSISISLSFLSSPLLFSLLFSPLFFSSFYFLLSLSLYSLPSLSCLPIYRILSLSWAVVALLPYYYFPYNQCRLPRRNDCPRLGGIYSIFSSTTTSAIPWYVRLALTPSKTLLIIIITIFITLLIATPSLQPACGAFT